MRVMYETFAGRNAPTWHSGQEYWASGGKT